MISNYKSLIAIAVVFNVAYLTYDLSIPSSNGGNQPLTRTDLNLYDDTPGCRIENVDPYSEEIKDYIYKVNAITCSSRKPLTYILKREDKLTLNINASLLTDYSMLPVTCCFSTIKRNPLGPHPDDNLIISDCAQFNDSVRVTGDLVKVECSNFFHKVYENVHITLQPPNATVLNKDAPNVLLIGIDGVSRSNLIRTMPRTMEFCEKNGWVNLKGYNKIADNTFPNLMAVLTGMNDSESERVCNPYDQSKLNGCEYFIWKRYKRHGYSTAHFQRHKSRLQRPPTDYYFRPYFLASNLLSSKRLCLNAHCTGPEKTGMRMQNAIKDFLSAVNNRTRGFGLFWMNSFSHEDFNCPSSMDDDFVSFFEGLRNEGHLDNTVILFFSDHGFRYGKIRLTHTGWMEERLPFIYLGIPDNFRTAHQEEYKNLLENSEKLTSPF
ncbi:hypothetical protein NQ318_015720 [Aromia moschata]|uniref:Uncharacterized protein n=1 Tax=Aromia moschata TaxID=1265417 RepID=A0AAV8XYQ7_9CUCU|nr:hypothetical protein NQ318_015720 [Aromia moschata]